MLVTSTVAVGMVFRDVKIDLYVVHRITYRTIERCAAMDGIHVGVWNQVADVPRASMVTRSTCGSTDSGFSAIVRGVPETSGVRVLFHSDAIVPVITSICKPSGAMYINARVGIWIIGDIETSGFEESDSILIGSAYGDAAVSTI